jgi:hypothetical protein
MFNMSYLKWTTQVTVLIEATGSMRIKYLRSAVGGQQLAAAGAISFKRFPV